MCCHHQSCNHDASCVGRVPIFQDLNAEEIKTLQDVTISRRYAKGELIFREGDPSEILFVVNDGLIKLSKLSEDGKEQIIRLFFPGEFFGQSALLQNKNHYANAVALEETTVCSIHKEDFLKTLNRNPEMSFKFMTAINERLLHADEWMSLLSLKEVEQRLAQVLLLFHEKINPNEDRLVLPVPKRDLASFIGTTPETLSRKFYTFVSQEMLLLHGRREVQFTNIDKLKKVAGLV